MLVRVRVPALFATDVTVVQSHVPALVHALALRPIAGEGMILRDTWTHIAQGDILVVAAFPRGTLTVPHVHAPGPLRSEGVTVFRPGGDRQATNVAVQDMVVVDAVVPEATPFVQAVRVHLRLLALVLVRVLAPVLAHDLRLIRRTRDTPEAGPVLGHSVEVGEATVGMISETADPGRQYSVSATMTSTVLQVWKTTGICYGEEQSFTQNGGIVGKEWRVFIVSNDFGHPILICLLYEA